MNVQNVRRQLTVFFLALAASSWAGAAGIKVKTGTWQMTETTVTQGNMVPAAALANMPPAQRAKIEAAMKARAGKPSTHAYKECVTQKDVDDLNVLRNDNEDCKQKIVSQSATHAVIEQNCPPPQATKTRVVIDAASPETMHMNMDMTRIEAGNNATVHVDIAGHWLQAACTKDAK